MKSHENNNVKYEGKLITGATGKDGGKVYLVENGKKRWISSPDVFQELGFKGENICQISDEELNAIPTGETIGTTDKRIYEIRYEIIAPFLKGLGIEIGAGAYPQLLPEGATCEYYDKRDEKELAEYFNVDESTINKVYSLDHFNERFPGKADFLIAHHVLEHCSCPISTVIEWNNYVKKGGIVVISVPAADYCPDKGRMVPPFEHVLLDFLLERKDDSFESKEHIYSNLWGWIDDGMTKGLNKFEIAKKAHECTKKKKNDLHWHAFNEELLKNIIIAAAFFGNKDIKIEATATPMNKTLGELIYIYRIENSRVDRKNELFLDFFEEVEKIKRKIVNAINRLEF